MGVWKKFHKFRSPYLWKLSNVVDKLLSPKGTFGIVVFPKTHIKTSWSRFAEEEDIMRMENYWPSFSCTNFTKIIIERFSAKLDACQKREQEILRLDFGTNDQLATKSSRKRLCIRIFSITRKSELWFLSEIISMLLFLLLTRPNSNRFPFLPDHLPE